MTEKEIIGGLAVVLGVCGYGVYMADVLRGRIRPHMFTWIIWGLLMSIGFAAQLAEESGPGTWNLGVSAFVTVLIAIASLFYGERNITRSDWIAFIASLSAIPVWLMTDSPLTAVFIICTIDAAAFYPTFRKSWFRPHEEGALVYGLSVPQFILSLMALDKVTLVTALYPAVIIVLNAALVSLLLWRRKALN